MSKPVFAARCMALIVAVAACCGRAGARGVHSDRTWLVVSDIHLDPYSARSQAANLGKDTNFALFRAALARMQQAVPDPALVLILGDFLMHDFIHAARRLGNGAPVEVQALRTMDLVARSFARAFPRAQFAIALGNNDSPCGDYRSALRTRYLAALAHIWAPLVNRRGASPTFERDFAESGHYVAALPGAGMRLIALNDVPLSTVYDGDCAAVLGYSDTAELRWLEAVLASTPPQSRNVVIMHVPPGFDAFVTQRIFGLAIVPFLYPDANARLLDALGARVNRVAYVFAGHTHRFDFRLQGGVPILVFGSLSPVYRNNPAFYALDVRSGGSIRDIATYVFDEQSQQWQPARSFDALWKVRGVNTAALAALHARLEREPVMRRMWDAASSGWPSKWNGMWSAWKVDWRLPWCAQTHVYDGFARCAGLVTRTVLFRLAAALTFITGTLALVHVIVRLTLIPAKTGHRDEASP